MAQADAHSHSHGHAPSADADTSRLAAALALILGFMAAEVVAGIVADSLALLSDAAHMLTDAVAIALALFALRLAQRPPGGSFTYGLKRSEILSAQLNGVTLLLLGILIVIEGVRRLFSPPDVEGSLVLIVALIGIPVNLAALRLIGSAERRSLNVEGAFRHILTDLFAFVATAIAGALILTTGFERADGIASLLVAATMLWASYGLLRDSGRVFMEAAPRDLAPQAIGEALAAEPDVIEVHDLHVWEVTTGMPAVSAHIIVGPDDDCHRARFRAAHLLADRFGVEHSTLQVEHRHDEGKLHSIERP
ncbi:MAG: cation transporter [Solirubrobacterales bacterium]|nr:cation transporter [Solirubrobacterales bacterium]